MVWAHLAGVEQEGDAVPARDGAHSSRIIHAPAQLPSLHMAASQASFYSESAKV